MKEPSTAEPRSGSARESPARARTVSIVSKSASAVLAMVTMSKRTGRCAEKRPQPTKPLSHQLHTRRQMVRGIPATPPCSSPPRQRSTRSLQLHEAPTMLGTTRARMMRPPSVKAKPRHAAVDCTETSSSPRSRWANWKVMIEPRMESMPPRKAHSVMVARVMQRCSNHPWKFHTCRAGCPASHVSMTYCWRNTFSNFSMVRSSIWSSRPAALPIILTAARRKSLLSSWQRREGERESERDRERERKRKKERERNREEGPARRASEEEQRRHGSAAAAALAACACVHSVYRSRGMVYRWCLPSLTCVFCTRRSINSAKRLVRARQPMTTMSCSPSPHASST